MHTAHHPMLPRQTPGAAPHPGPPGPQRLAPIWHEAPLGDLPVYHQAASQALERQLLERVPAGCLMARAGRAVAQLALAMRPHGRRVLVLCGPGNNGGDGLSAARWLHQAGRAVQVCLLADPHRLPTDAHAAWQAAIDAGVPWRIGPPRIDEVPPDLVIDALLGLGQHRAPGGDLARAIQATRAWPDCPVLAVDLPTGLGADSGQTLGEDCIRATATLALLSLKPGLLTGSGRDWAGELWLDTLGTDTPASHPATAYGVRGARARQLYAPRAHAQHKGSFGDVWVVGGAPGMTGAATLAAEAALAAGAGRVYLATPGALSPDRPGRPELMQRSWDDALAEGLPEQATVVCGCGAGAGVTQVLPALLQRARQLVLDADALNALASAPALMRALAARAARGGLSVLTPHPLEAARLLGSSTAQVQAQRLGLAQALADQTQAVVVLKGSGTVIAAPGCAPLINSSGNARLSSPGTGDVLAGWTGGLVAQHSAGLAATPQALQSLCAAACWIHGRAAEHPGATRNQEPGDGLQRWKGFEDAQREAARLPLRAQALIEQMRDVVSNF